MLRIRIEDTLIPAWALIENREADVVIVEFPDHIFQLEDAEPYTHVLCLPKAADVVLPYLEPMSGYVQPHVDGHNMVSIYVPRPAHEIISALHPFFKQQRIDEDIAVREAFQALVDGEIHHLLAEEATVAPVILRGLNISEIMLTPQTMMEAGWNATEQRMAEPHLDIILVAVAPYGGGDFRPAAWLEELTGLLGGDSDALLAGMANYYHPEPDPVDYNAERPIFHPDQVMSPRHLKPGRTYILVSGDNHYRELVRFERIEERWDGRWMCFERLDPQAFWRHSSHHLAGLGLEPYMNDDGTVAYWNDTNYVLRVPRTPKFVFRMEHGKLVRRRNT